MDKRCSWEKRFQPSGCIDAANIIVQSNGGVRDGDCAAAAFIIGLWHDREQHFEPLVIHGTFLSEVCGVLMVEAIALEESVLEVQRLMQMNPSFEN